MTPPASAAPGELWKDRPDEHDFAAARSYLSLLLEPAQAKRVARALERQEELAHFLAKDILRASGLALLPAEDPEVAKDLAKVHAATPLSPVLLVRGTPLWVADGYHRVCASYHVTENAPVPCRIVARPGGAGRPDG